MAAIAGPTQEGHGILTKVAKTLPPVLKPDANLSATGLLAVTPNPPSSLPIKAPLHGYS